MEILINFEKLGYLLNRRRLYGFIVLKIGRVMFRVAIEDVLNVFTWIGHV